MIESKTILIMFHNEEFNTLDKKQREMIIKAINIKHFLFKLGFGKFNGVEMDITNPSDDDILAVLKDNDIKRIIFAGNKNNISMPAYANKYRGYRCILYEDACWRKVGG